VTGRRDQLRRLERRQGTFLLGAIFVALLSGTFTFSRIRADLGAIEIRVILFALILVAFIAWDASTVSKIKRKKSGIAPLGWFLAWTLWMVISAAWAPAISLITEQIVGFGLMVGFTGMAYLISRKLEMEDFDVLWKLLVLTSVIFLIGSVFSEGAPNGRSSAFGGGPNVFVRIMATGMFTAIYLFSRARKWPYLIIATLLLSGAVLSGSRGGLLALIAVAGLYVIFLGRSRSKLRLVMIILGGLTIVWALLPLFLPRAAALVETRYIDAGLIQGYTAGRDQIWADAFKLLTDNVIFGAGLNGYYGTYGVYSGFTYPHNLFLATGAEAGVIGVLLLSAFILSATFYVLRRSTTVFAPVFTWTLFVYILIASLFSGDYYDSRFAWFFLVVAVAQAQKVRSDYPAARKELRRT
jgi:O-antigen ligase